jgi:hypothetical protein
MNRKETPLLGIVLWMWKFLGSVSTIRVGKKRKMLLHPGAFYGVIESRGLLFYSIKLE